MAADTNVKSFSQQPDAGPLKSTDLLLIAQPWAQGLEGYKTVNITVRTAYDTIMKEAKTTGLGGLGVIGENAGLLGTGSTADPLRVDPEWINKNYAIGALTNISQVGKLNQTTLPIGQAATGFSYPVDGLSRMALAMPTDDGFETIVPTTDGLTTSYNYGSGDLIGNDLATYQATESKYLPRLPEGYDESQYTVEQIFSCSKAYMVLKLRHISNDRSLDELAVVATHGTFDGAYHTTYFLTRNNLYVENLPSGSDARRLEAKLKYTAWEQGGKLYLSRFDIQSTDTAIGSDPKRVVGLVIYQLLSLGDEPERLTPLAVKGLKSSFLGNVWENQSIVKLTDGLYGTELNLSAVTEDKLTFNPLNMEVGSQALDRFLDVLQFDEDTVFFKLSRSSTFMVRTAIGSQQQLTVNYTYNYKVDMANKTIDGVELIAKDYQPTLVVNDNIYSVDMKKQEKSLWSGSEGLIEFYSEDNFSFTTPTSSSGDSTVTILDTASGEPVVSADVSVVGSCCGSIYSDQISVPLSTTDGSPNLMFLSGDELSGYQLGGIKIQSEDKPSYSYVDVRGETIQGYSLDLDRFAAQQTVNGVNLSSYTAVYFCESGKIFDALDGVYNTTCETRFGLVTIDLNELKVTDGKAITQYDARIEVSPDTGKESTIVTPIESFFNYRDLRIWMLNKFQLLNDGKIKIVPFFDGSHYKAFVHITLNGGIGVGPSVTHLVCECVRGDNDFTLGAVVTDSVVTKEQSYDGTREMQIDQPDLHNATVFVEASTKRIAVFYGNFGEYSTNYPFKGSRLYQYGFTSGGVVKELPFASNFGLVTYYLDPTNGVSFTSKDNWLEILHTTEQVPFSDMVPMMSRSGAMLLAAPSLRSGYFVKVLEPIPFFMSGVNGEIPVQDISLEGIPLTNGVGVGYLYLGLVSGKPKIELRTTGTAERPDYTLIAVVNMGSTGFVNISTEPFIRLGPYRLSTKSKGSAIPVTAPRPDIQQFTLWD